MIARIAWYTALGACALVTAGLQLDRQAGASPHLAGIVPQPFRSVAQARIVVASIKAGEPQDALDEAERLVVRRPVPAQSLRLLAIAQTRAGAIEQSIVSIQLAAQRGWRDIAAQEAMARLALYAGDVPEAARRFTALFIRSDADDEMLREIGDQLFALPGDEAHDTIAAIVADSKRWNIALLRRGPQIMQAADFAALVIQTSERGVRYDCGPLETAVDRATRGDAQAGAFLRELYERQCPE